MHLFSKHAFATLAALFMAVGVAHSSTTLSSLQATSGWTSCTTCTNSTGTAGTSTMTQNISSPSLDGKSAHFHLGSGAPLADALWYKHPVMNSSATHFIYDVRFYYKNASVPTGMEFSTSEHVSTRWYRWDWQCSYYFGVWRVWDNGNARWVNTTVPCTRPVAYSWNHATFEGHRYNGKVYFDAVTVNGRKYYVNKSFYPATAASGNFVTVHFQLNGGKSGAAVDAWGDEFKLTYW